MTKNCVIIVTQQVTVLFFPQSSDERRGFLVAKEWSECEDGFCADAPAFLKREIHALAARSRTLSARLNVRELIAPMLFLGVSGAPLTRLIGHIDVRI